MTPKIKFDWNGIPIVFVIFYLTATAASTGLKNPLLLEILVFGIGLFFLVCFLHLFLITSDDEQVARK